MSADDAVPEAEAFRGTRGYGAGVLVQLSGVPGSGKSTLARGLAAGHGLVVLDTDVVKSALLERDLSVADAGPAAYGVVLALAADLLAQGHGVVVDSPCRYPALLAAGQQVAEEAGVGYRFVELWVDDPATLLPRLDGRRPRPSQVASSTDAAPGTAWEHGTAVATLRAWQDELVRPEAGYVRLDAALPPDELLRAASNHLASGRAPGSARARD
jgi:predicted kinase